MNYAKIVPFDIANGPGIRVSLFVSGCDIHCKNCFNKDLWNRDYGKPFTKETAIKLAKLCNKPHIAGISILGGEPTLFSDEINNLIQFLKYDTKYGNPDLNIWMYSGHTFEELIEQNKLFMLDNLNVLVDGPFIEDLKDISLKFRGSSNQRLIDIQKTLSSNSIVLYES